MNVIPRYIFLCLIFLFFEVFVLNKVEIGMGTQLFILPLYIMLLPFETSVFILMLIGFFLGIFADIMLNTFGINASSLLLTAYLRPIIFNIFILNEENNVMKRMTISNMGWAVFNLSYGLLLLVYITWFVVLEVFRLSDWLLILRNIVFSFVASYLLAQIIQLFFRKKKS